jgi:hypothetical protein
LEKAELSMAEESRYEHLPPEMVLENLARFQSRAEYPRDPMDSDLSDVSVFDHDFAGLISVWADPDDKKIYVINGHRRLRLAKRLQVPVVYVQFLKAERDADAFAKGVEISLAQWAFEQGDKLLWAIASRRAAVERALYTRWLDVDGEAAARLYKYYPDLGRRYSSFPRDYTEAARV